MKIYDEVVIDMNPESSTYEEVLSEDSYEHDGPVMEMKIGNYKWAGGEEWEDPSTGVTYKVEGRKKKDWKGKYKKRNLSRIKGSWGVEHPDMFGWKELGSKSQGGDWQAHDLLDKIKAEAVGRHGRAMNVGDNPEYKFDVRDPSSVARFIKNLPNMESAIGNLRADIGGSKYESWAPSLYKGDAPKAGSRPWMEGLGEHGEDWKRIIGLKESVETDPEYQMGDDTGGALIQYIMGKPTGPTLDTLKNKYSDFLERDQLAQDIFGAEEGERTRGALDEIGDIGGSEYRSGFGQSAIAGIMDKLRLDSATERRLRQQDRKDAWDTGVLSDLLGIQEEWAGIG